MTWGIRSRAVSALVLGGFSLITQAANMVAPVGSTVTSAQTSCAFESDTGLEFRFPAADEVLQPYGFVLWRRQPSMAAEPLSYANVTGRRGTLSGSVIVRQGVRWFEGTLDDCSTVYAEDASTYSKLTPLDHLAFYGKVVFDQWYFDAWDLVGFDVVVNGAGLEPRQRLYTPVRGDYLPLYDGQRLTVVGIDTRRYAHAKGVGPFFLEVLDAAGRVGLIKYNPSYVSRVESELMLSALKPPPPPDPLLLASLGLPVEIESEGWWLWCSYILTVSYFSDEQAALAAERKIADDGYLTRTLPRQETLGDVTYKLQIAELDSEQAAVEIAQNLAARFEWVGELHPPLHQASR